MPSDCLRFVCLGRVWRVVSSGHQILRCRARMCRHCDRPRPDTQQVDSLTYRARAEQPFGAESTKSVIIVCMRWHDINLICFTASGRRTPTSELTCGSEFCLLGVCIVTVVMCHTDCWVLRHPFTLRRASKRQHQGCLFAGHAAKWPKRRWSTMSAVELTGTDSNNLYSSAVGA